MSNQWSTSKEISVAIRGNGALAVVRRFFVSSFLYLFIFTALHAMQTRSSDENSVCLSVRPSVCQTRDL